MKYAHEIRQEHRRAYPIPVLPKPTKPEIEVSVALEPGPKPAETN